MSEKSVALRVALFAAIVAIAAPPLFSPAHSHPARYQCVVGTVTDPSSIAVAVTIVTPTNVGTGGNHQSKSGASSAYRLLTLVPGTYRAGANAQVTSDVPNVTENPLSCATLMNGIQPGSETSTSTLGDL